jgi:hypothetical protein
MLTGVGMLEFEFIEEERSCFIFMGGTWIVIWAGGGNVSVMVCKVGL